MFLFLFFAFLYVSNNNNILFGAWREPGIGRKYTCSERFARWPNRVSGRLNRRLNKRTGHRLV